MKMNKTYTRVVVPKDLDRNIVTEITWIAKNIRVYYLSVIVSADADIKKNDLVILGGVGGHVEDPKNTLQIRSTRNRL